jgi:hypothetical protein
MFHPESIKFFKLSLLYLFTGKAFSIMTPYILKFVVDSITFSTIPALVAAKTFAANSYMTYL